MRVCVIGAGSVGLFLANILSPYARVSLVRRASAYPQSVKQSATISLRGAIDATSLPIEVAGEKSSEATELVRSAEIIFVCVKAHQLSSLKVLFQEIGAQKVVLVQNGLGIIDVARTSGLRQGVSVARMLCNFGVLRLEEYAVQLAGAYAVTVAPREPWVVELVNALLIPSGFSVTQSTTVPESEWRKALINIFVNPICTILQGKNGIMIDQSELQEVGMSMVEEAQRVASAEGHDIAPLTREQLIEAITPFRDNINSNLADHLAARESDMQFLLGEVEKRAGTHQIPVPTLQAIYRLYQAVTRR